MNEFLSRDEITGVKMKQACRDGFIKIYLGSKELLSHEEILDLCVKSDEQSDEKSDKPSKVDTKY